MTNRNCVRHWLIFPLALSAILCLPISPTMAGTDAFTSHGVFRQVTQYNSDASRWHCRSGDPSVLVGKTKEQVNLHTRAGDKALLITDLIELGNLYLILEEYPNARAAFSQALELQRSIGNDDALKLAVCWHSLGQAQERMRDTTAALDGYRAALDHWLKTKNQLAIADELANIGDCLFSKKQFADSEVMLKRALAAREATTLTGSPSLEMLLDDIATSLEQQGKSQEALKYIHRAERLRAKSGKLGIRMKPVLLPSPYERRTPPHR